MRSVLRIVAIAALMMSALTRMDLAQHTESSAMSRPPATSQWPTMATAERMRICLDQAQEVVLTTRSREAEQVCSYLVSTMCVATPRIDQGVLILAYTGQRDKSRSSLGFMVIPEKTIRHEPYWASHFLFQEMIYLPKAHAIALRETKHLESLRGGIALLREGHRAYVKNRQGRVESPEEAMLFQQETLRLVRR